MLLLIFSQVPEGDTADFSCEVIGEPKPEVTWFYNGRQLEDEGRYMIFEEDGLHHLEVYEVSPEDVGSYVAKAENQFGEVTCSADLTLEGKLEPHQKNKEQPRIMCQKDDNLTTFKGRDVSLDTFIRQHFEATLLYIRWKKVSRSSFV